MPKKKKTVKTTTDGRSRKTISTKNKGFTFSDLSNAFDDQKVSISINTFYTLYRRNGDIRTAIRKTAKKI